MFFVLLHAVLRVWLGGGIRKLSNYVSLVEGCFGLSFGFLMCFLCFCIFCFQKLLTVFRFIWCVCGVVQFLKRFLRVVSCFEGSGVFQSFSGFSFFSVLKCFMCV